MTSLPNELRDLIREILRLVDENQVFTDLHIEQDRPIMIKTPRGWEEAPGGPVLLWVVTVGALALAHSVDVPEFEKARVRPKDVP